MKTIILTYKLGRYWSKFFLFLMVMTLCQLFLLSCQKDPNYPKNLTFQNLEMVVKIEEDQLDTIQSFTNSPFQAAINFDAYQRVIQVYENDQLLRSVFGQEVRTLSTGNGLYSLRFTTLTSSNDELSYLSIYKGNEAFLSEYFCLYNYPFEGINCFKIAK